MQKTYCTEYQVMTSNCDFRGTWRPSAILECMQEAAGMHAELLSIGRNTLLQRNIVWILTRSEVVMDRYPRMGETVTVETFPMACRRWFFPRYFIFRDETGEQIGYAGSLWALLDVNTRKMVAPGEWLAFLPDNRDLTAPMGLPATVADAPAEAEESDFLPVYTDLDINGHVNNVRYLDWACNALGIDTMRAYQLARFAVNYDAEILPGQAVHAALRRSGEQFSFSGFRDGARSFDVGGTLALR